MLDFICMVFAEMWAAESKRKIQNDNVCLHRESNQRSLAFQRVPSNYSAIGTVNNMLLKLLQYFLYDTIMQELCVVCKGYIEKKRTLVTCSFVMDTFEIRDDLYKRRNVWCLVCQWHVKLKYRWIWRWTTNPLHYSSGGICGRLLKYVFNGKINDTSIIT